MRKYTLRTGIVGTVLVLLIAGNATAMALPVKRPVHSPEPVTSVNGSSPTTGSDDSGSNDNGSGGSSSPGSDDTNSAAPTATAQPQQTCQNHEAAINAIIKRVDTRSQNQINLFDTIAARVENFYTGQSKAVSNYSQLTAAITAAKTQANLDLSTLQANGMIDCSNDPKGMITAFQTQVKTTTADLQNYRTTVKNLIMAVQGVVGSSATGGQQ